MITEREVKLDSDLEQLCSFGTSMFLQFLRSQIDNPRPLLFSCIFINIETILRNTYSKEVNLKQHIEAAYADMRMLFSVVAEYVDAHRLRLPDPRVIVYSCPYEIPAAYARKLSPMNTAVHEAAVHFRQTMDVKAQDSYNNLYKVREYIAPGPFPSEQLYNFERSMHCKGKSVLLISHIPVDYHLLWRYPDVYLLESFTGKAVQRKDIAQKVFKVTGVPFVPSTHVVLGDKVYVDAMAKRKMKKEILKTANNENWIALSSSSIAKSASRTLGIPSPMLDIRM